MRSGARQIGLWLIGACFAMQAVAGLPASDPPPAAGPLDTHWPDERQQLRIRLGEAWESTRQENEQRWEEQLRERIDDGRTRERILRLRRVALLEAMLERFQPDEARRIDAYREMAEIYAQFDLRSRHHDVRRRMIEALPGRADVAAEALAAILRITPWQAPERTEHGADWVGYAARRLIALHRAGLLPAADPAAVDAVAAMARLHRLAGRFADADALLRAADPQVQRLPVIREERVELDVAVGRWAEALQRMVELRTVGDEQINQRIRFLEQLDRFTRTASVATDASMQMRWTRLREGFVENFATAVSDLLRETADGGPLIEADASRYIATWAAVDRHLREAGVGAREQLRDRQADEGRSALDQARRSNDPQSLLSAYRQQPRSPAGREALLAYGRQSLLEGRPALAARSFQDVLDHSADDDFLPQRAQVGLWQAWAVQPTRQEALRASLDGAPDRRRWPWRGEMLTAHDIASRLRAERSSSRRAAARSIDELTIQRIERPITAGWPPALTKVGSPLHRYFAREGAELVPLKQDELLLSVAGELHALDRDGGRRWSKRLTERPIRRASPNAGDVVLTAPLRPAVADGRVFTRTDLSVGGKALTNVAALDPASGRELWTTATDDLWRQRWPISDPVADEGRVYVLTLDAAGGETPPSPALYLTCLDAADGRMRWETPLGRIRPSIETLGGAAGPPETVDLAHFGAALTVDQGAVFIASGAGLAARCDARDGLIEWLRTYNRALLGEDVAAIFPRRAIPPIPVGDGVAIAPRDRYGVMMLDADTGELRWEAGYAPSDRFVGATEGLLVFHDRHRLVGLDAATGAYRWLTGLGDGILGAGLHGARLAAGTADALHQLDLETGRITRRLTLDQPLAGLHQLGDRLVGLSEKLGPATANTDPPTVMRAVPSMLAAAAPNHSLQTGAGRLIVPDEAQRETTGGRLFVLGESRLVAIDPASWQVAWQRTIDPGVGHLAFARGVVLLSYPSQLVAIDVENGSTRYRLPTPGLIDRTLDAGPHLLIAKLGKDRFFARIDPASGEVQWQRRFFEFGSGDNEARFDDVRLEGGQLKLLAALRRQGEALFEITLDAETGRPTDVRRLTDLRDFPRAARWAGDRVWYVTEREHLRSVNLRDPDTPREYKHGLRQFNDDMVAFEVLDPWVRIAAYNRHHDRYRLWVGKWNETDFRMERSRPGVIKGDRLYEFADGVVRVIDLQDREPAFAVRLPAAPIEAKYPQVISIWEDDEGFVVASAHEPVDDRVARVRVDRFTNDGTLRSSALLARDFADAIAPIDPHDPAWRNSDVQPVGEALVCQIGARLLVFDRDVVSETTVQPTAAPFHRAEPITVDGRLDDWVHVGPAVDDAGSSGVRVKLAHRDDRIHLAVSHPDDRVDPLPLDRIEIDVSNGDQTRHLVIGVDAAGHEHAAGAEGVVAAVDHDLAGWRHQYELSMPRSFVEDSHGEAAGMAIRVFNASSDQSPAWAWNGSPSGGLRPVFRTDLTWSAAQAGEAIARSAPGLEASRRLIDDLQRLHLGDESWAMAFYRDMMRAAPFGPLAIEAMVRLDQALRRDPDHDVRDQVLQVAWEAGVSEDARRHYQRLAGAVLSQWVYIPTSDVPRKIQLEWHDGDNWEHRVSWGLVEYGISSPVHRPARRIVDALPPAGRWIELRIPLIWVDLQDRPIHGFAFMQQGGDYVLWDRTAILIDGKEHVLIDDETPAGSTRDWTWVGEEKRSGRRSHRVDDRIHNKRDEERYHLSGLREPIDVHVPKLRTNLELSQFVHPDPEARPESLVIRVVDNRRESHGHVWGKPIDGFEHRGGLPPAGRWSELRIPLQALREQDRTLRELRFRSVGGRATWDSTALAWGEHRRMLIDEPANTLDTSGDTEWTDSPVHLGAAAHRTRGNADEHEIGWRHDVQLVVAGLGESAVALLKRNIPELGPTEEARRAFDSLLRLAGPDLETRAELFEWFIRTLPDHPQVQGLAGELLEMYRQLDRDDPLKATEQLLDEAGVDDDVL